MEKQEYEKSVLEYEDVQDALAYRHELSLAEGYKKGLEEGMEKGMEKGIEKGLAEGREALLNAARNFLRMGLSVHDVAQATGLTEEEVGELKTEK